MVLSLSVGWCVWDLRIREYAVAWVSLLSWAPFVLNSGRLIKSTFLEFSILDPSAASLSASVFPTIPEWPLIHSKVVHPALFRRMFTMGRSRLAWAIFAKSLLMWESRSLHSESIAHFESVFMWRRSEPWVS